MEKIKFCDLKVEIQKSVRDIDELCDLDLEDVEIEAIADRVVTDLYLLQDDDGLQILPDLLIHSHLTDLPPLPPRIVSKLKDLMNEH